MVVSVFQSKINRGIFMSGLSGGVRSRISNGFVPQNAILHRLYNLSLAVFLIAIAMPAMVAISLLLAVTQGRPIFYRGDRMGKDGQAFGILKFRTLDTEAARHLTRDRVLPAGSGLETPVGLFLRETRLDELPQLFNVLFGDMNICGPRPVRAEIATMNAGTIPGYTIRFAVKPGILGPTQAYMSHGTPKAVRARFNAKLCRSPVSYWGELRMISLVAICVITRTASRLSAQIAERIRRGRPDAPDLRGGVSVGYADAGGIFHPVGTIDRDTMYLPGAVPAGYGRIILTLPDGKSRAAVVRIADASAVRVGHGLSYGYEACGDFSQHVLERYLFQKVVVPHRSHFLADRAQRSIARRFRHLTRNRGAQISDVQISKG